MKSQITALKMQRTAWKTRVLKLKAQIEVLKDFFENFKILNEINNMRKTDAQIHSRKISICLLKIKLSDQKWKIQDAEEKFKKLNAKKIFLESTRNVLVEKFEKRRSRYKSKIIIVD